MIRLSFLGACNEVGRSATLVEAENQRILIDYGSKINVKPTQYPKSVNGRINAVLLSHAHLDHSGAIPILFHEGKDCPVYALNITKPFSKMLYLDSLKIARHEGEEERFSKKDVNKAIRHFKSIEYRQPFHVGNIRVTAFDAGHIPGSAMYLLEIKGKKILYACDFNLQDTRLIKGADLDLPQVDILITESTYAQREHPDREKEERKMIDVIEETIANDGIVLISCFAIARTQEVLLILDEYEIKEDIYIDGMAKKATRIINDYPRLLRDYNQVEKALHRLNVEFVTRGLKRKKIVKRPCIILTTSGMLSGGPVVDYLERIYDKKNCSLILTGFQVPGTEGALLLQTGHYLHEDLDLEVKMNVRKFDFSSHASRTDLFRFARRLNPEKIFCVHGDNTVRYAEELREEYGFDATAPIDSRVFKLV